MKRVCLRVNIKDEKSKRRIMHCLAGIEGVESVRVDQVNAGKITVIGDADPVSLLVKLGKRGFKAELLSVGPAKRGFKAELLSVGPAKEEKFEAEKKLGSKRDTENRGTNHYLGVQRAEVLGGFGGMNRAIEDNEGSEKRIFEAVAGFGDFTSIEVDIKKGMVTVVGKSVPVSVALKVREMGYRAKLLSLGPAAEVDPDEEDNADLYPNYTTLTAESYPSFAYTVVRDEYRTTRCTIA